MFMSPILILYLEDHHLEVVSNHGDRRSLRTGVVAPFQKAIHGLQMEATNYFRSGVILQVPFINGVKWAPINRQKIKVFSLVGLFHPDISSAAQLVSHLPTQKLLRFSLDLFKQICCGSIGEYTYFNKRKKSHDRSGDMPGDKSHRSRGEENTKDKLNSGCITKIK